MQAQFSSKTKICVVNLSPIQIVYLHVVEVDKVVLTLSTIYYVHPSHIASVFKSRPRLMLVPNCSLRVCCNCTKLVGALQLIQIRFLLVWSRNGLGCTYSINHIMCSSIPYCSSLFWLLFLLFRKISHLQVNSN